MLAKQFILAVFLLVSANCANSSLLDPTTVSANYISDKFIGHIKASPLDQGLCQQQLFTLVSNLENAKSKDFLRSFRFFDAWGKIPAGITYGHLEDLGNYPQCMSIDYDLPLFPTKEKSHFVGKYCHAKIPISQLLPITNLKMKSGVEKPTSPPIGLGLGICVPESCSEEEVSEFLNEALAEIQGPNVTVSHCSIDKKPDFEPLDIVAICIFSILSVLLVLSSVYDYYTRTRGLRRNPLLLVFSLSTNSQKLFGVNLKNNPNSVDCIHGIRVLSMIWVLYGHCSIIALTRPNINLVDAYHFIRSTFALLLFTAPISVDTFFFISGFLIVWIGMGTITKSKGKLNILVMYVMRYLRLTPMVAMIMLFIMTMMKFMGNGPVWDSTISAQVYSCQVGWWRNLLYIQNYFNDEICVGQTWYLAVDTQLYLFAPFILIGFYRWGYKFIVPLVVLIAAGTGGIYAMFIEKGYNSIVFTLDSNVIQRFHDLYVPTYFRFPSWVIGTIFGYIMFNLKDKEIKLSKITVFLGWIVSVGTLVAIVFGPRDVMQDFGKTSPVEAASYEAFSRISWAICLGWIVFACQRGYGGIINEFLSHHQWQVMSRLSFAIYLIHMSFQSVILANTKTEGVFSTFEMAGMFWYSFGISTLCAVALILVCESPVIQLEKMLLAPRPKPELPLSHPVEPVEIEKKTPL